MVPERFIFTVSIAPSSDFNYPVHVTITTGNQMCIRPHAPGTHLNHWTVLKPPLLTRVPVLWYELDRRWQYGLLLEVRLLAQLAERHVLRWRRRWQSRTSRNPRRDLGLVVRVRLLDVLLVMVILLGDYAGATPSVTRYLDAVATRVFQGRG